MDRVTEQRVLQALIDLRNQLVEIQKLRAAIQLAEANQRRDRLVPLPKSKQSSRNTRRKSILRR